MIKQTLVSAGAGSLRIQMVDGVVWGAASTGMSGGADTSTVIALQTPSVADIADLLL